MRIAIIDDEINATKMLELELMTISRDLEIIGVYNDPVKAFEELNIETLDVLFLDVEMPRLSGFDLLEKWSDRSFDIIFTTAYSEYAIKAIKESALDYLLKPIDTTELKDAVTKVILKRSKQNDVALDRLLEKINKTKSSLIKIPTSDGITFKKPEDIIYCKSESNYVHIFTIDGKLFIAKTLKYMEEILPPSYFIRCHHSYIVNQYHIKEYLREDGGYLHMSNGDRIKVAQSKRNNLDF